jgi:hypothetical protein
MRIHVGCSGWFYSHWRGIFYPRQEPTTKNWFAYYANVFGTVELNAPFYRWPTPATVRRWKRDAPPSLLAIDQGCPDGGRDRIAILCPLLLINEFCLSVGTHLSEPICTG